MHYKCPTTNLNAEGLNLYTTPTKTSTCANPHIDIAHTLYVYVKVFKPVCAFGMILVRNHSLYSGKAQAIILNPSSVQDLSNWPDLLYLSNPKYRKSKFQQWWFVQWHIGCCISRSSVWYTGGCPTRTTRPLEFIWYLSGFRGLCYVTTPRSAQNFGQILIRLTQQTNKALWVIQCHTHCCLFQEDINIGLTEKSRWTFETTVTHQSFRCKITAKYAATIDFRRLK